MINPVNLLRGVLVLLLLITVNAQAQKTGIYTEKYAVYREALELFDKEKYSAAQDKFAEAIAIIRDKHDEASINSEFHYAMCALKLFHPDAEFLLQQFITNHPQAPQVRLVHMHLGRHFFNNKKWKKAIEYFDLVDRYNLSARELSEYYYKRGFAFFQLKDFNAAAQNFAEIKDTDNDYKEPALYYYSHIAYTQKNYQAALDGFNKLKNGSFAHLVPYYIAQIYYLQKDYEKVVEYAPPVLDTTKGLERVELARIIGDSYYELKKFDIAVPFLEIYMAAVSPTREENYQMGYAYYRSGFQSKAIPYLNKATNVKDAMAQAAYYHLADCYLRTNEKTYARNAYEGAASLNFDTKVQEDALFSYAKLAYELSYNPFHEAITALQRYLDKFPNSSRRDEAYSFLINVYLTTRNYKEAQNALEKVQDKDFRFQSAFQMVSFNRGVELFQSGYFQEAISSFEKVKKYPIDKRLNAESKYWIAESYYKQNDFTTAIDAYTAFQQEPGAYSSKLYNLANYNIAYCWYEKGMVELAKTKSTTDVGGYFGNSLFSFRKYISDKNETDKIKMVDASLRIGDIYYFKKENDNAIEFYEKSLSYNSGSGDYALFQAAHCKHLLRKFDPAISTYKKLIIDYPNSNYVPSSIFEMGNIYRENENNLGGIEQYERFISKYPNNQDVRIAIRYLGLLYYKEKNYSKAENYYRKLLTEYNNPQDTKAALDGLKDVLKAQDRLDEWAALVKQYDKSGTTGSEIEMEFWISAEDSYNNNDCDKAIEKMNKYIQQYPSGQYIVTARFYRAECNFAKGNKDISIADYEYVFAQQGNSFREVTAQRLGSTFFNKKDYNMSNKYYLELEKVASKPTHFMESYTALMRGFYLLKDYNNALVYAGKVLKENTISSDLKAESNFITGMCQLAISDYDNAMKSLNAAIAIDKSGWRWAESKYHVISIYFLKKEHKKCETEIMNFVKIKPNFDYWIAKSYILLGENYMALGDAFQAKATLKSVIDHYKGDDDIVATAQAKYDAIISQENQQNEQRMMQQENNKIEEMDDSFEKF